MTTFYKVSLFFSPPFLFHAEKSTDALAVYSMSCGMARELITITMLSDHPRQLYRMAFSGISEGLGFIVGVQSVNCLYFSFLF